MPCFSRRVRWFKRPCGSATRCAHQRPANAARRFGGRSVLGVTESRPVLGPRHGTHCRAQPLWVPNSTSASKRTRTVCRPCWSCSPLWNWEEAKLGVSCKTSNRPPIKQWLLQLLSSRLTPYRPMNTRQESPTLPETISTSSGFPANSLVFHALRAATSMQSCETSLECHLDSAPGKYRPLEYHGHGYTSGTSHFVGE